MTQSEHMIMPDFYAGVFSSFEKPQEYTPKVIILLGVRISYMQVRTHAGRTFNESFNAWDIPEP